ncbi:MAG: GNAT family N-acetyltransferase [Bacilli bacterium]
MIKECFSNDVIIINKFLKKMNYSLITEEKFKSNPFTKYATIYFENNCIGFIEFSIIYDRIEINYIYIEEIYRNLKFGSKLIEYVIKIGIANNVKNITLEVNENNTLAIQLYEKYNFKICAIRNHYYGKDNGYLMIREMM